MGVGGGGIEQLRTGEEDVGFDGLVEGAWVDVVPGEEAHCVGLVGHFEC